MKLYRKKQLQQMEPWAPGYDMTGVSVSVTDTLDGSPKSGDMIAVNANDPTDRWLVSAEFFRENCEEVEPQP
jgi:hypothetical protein